MILFLGTFIVRDSNSFPGAFGLALKVATPPPNKGDKVIFNEGTLHILDTIPQNCLKKTSPGHK